MTPDFGLNGYIYPNQPPGYGPAGPWTDGAPINQTTSIPIGSQGFVSFYDIESIPNRDSSLDDPNNYSDIFACALAHAISGEVSLGTNDWTGSCAALLGSDVWKTSADAYGYLNGFAVGETYVWEGDDGTAHADTMQVQFDQLCMWINSVIIGNHWLGQLPVLPTGQVYQVEPGPFLDQPSYAPATELDAVFNVVDQTEGAGSLLDVTLFTSTFGKISAAGQGNPGNPAHVSAGTIAGHFTGIGSKAVTLDGTLAIGTTAANYGMSMNIVPTRFAAGGPAITDVFPHPLNHEALLGLWEARATIGFNSLTLRGVSPRYRVMQAGSPPLRQRQNNRGNLGYPPLRASRQGSGIFPPLRQRQNAAR